MQADSPLSSISQTGISVTFHYTGETDGAQFYWNTGDMPVWLKGSAVNTHLFKRPGAFLISLVVIAKDGKQTGEHIAVRINVPIEFLPDLSLSK